MTQLEVVLKGLEDTWEPSQGAIGAACDLLRQQAEEIKALRIVVAGALSESVGAIDRVIQLECAVVGHLRENGECDACVGGDVCSYCEMLELCSPISAMEVN